VWLVLTSPVTGFLVVVVSSCVFPPSRPGLSVSVCEVSQPVMAMPVKRVAANKAVLKSFIKISGKKILFTTHDANPADPTKQARQLQIRGADTNATSFFFL
jgi:hypothetical protein